MRNIFVSIFILLLSCSSFSQVSRSSELYRVLKVNDSLLFNLGYNNCDISQFEQLVSDSFEFYHDEAGITSSKTAFIAGVRDGLCKLPYKAKRVLVEQSLEVYPLKKNNVLYGAVETGEHKFYAVETDKSEHLTSTAKFTMLWLLENGKWKLSRVLSFDHIKP